LKSIAAYFSQSLALKIKRCTPAVAGDQQTLGGKNGSFTFTAALSKGSVAKVSTVAIDGVIIATAAQTYSLSASA
jgi:hypothetical protein